MTTTLPILVIVAVAQEAEAILRDGPIDGVRVVVGGVGRTNAACATTATLLREGPFAAVLSVGIAGALPADGDEAPRIGSCVVASSCVYAEEGLVTPSGFQDMTGLGFPLGDFEGNVVPVDPRLLALLGTECRVGPIATVATCSGTDAAAREVVRRTGALAEAMEGAAVVHAARRLGVAGIEIRVISNTTGDRERQVWSIAEAFGTLGAVVRRAAELISISTNP